MNGRVRGRSFKPGNPGRPRGSKNKTTLLIEQMMDGQAEQLVQTLLKKAQSGDVACLRMVLDRLCPPRKGQPIDVVMPPLNSSQDVLSAIGSIWTALGEGRLTPDEARDLSVVVDQSIRAIELYDMIKRVTALEEARADRNEKNNSSPS